LNLNSILYLNYHNDQILYFEKNKRKKLLLLLLFFGYIVQVTN